jgi:hypothetical protein
VRSGSNTATGCATAHDNSQLKGAVIDIVRFFEIACRLPLSRRTHFGEDGCEGDPQILHRLWKTIPPSNERVGAASVEEPFLAELTSDRGAYLRSSEKQRIVCLPRLGRSLVERKEPKV